MSRLSLDSDLGVCQLLFPGVICLSPRVYRGTFSLYQLSGERAKDRTEKAFPGHEHNPKVELNL